MDKNKIITVEYDGLELNTTIKILEDNDLEYEIEDNIITVYQDERLNDCCIIEPESFFYEYFLMSFNTGKIIEFESNYKVPREDQLMLFDYKESDNYPPYISSWCCYFDNDGKLTSDEDLINKLKKEKEDSDGQYSTDGLNIQRLDPNNLIQDLGYYY